MIWIIGNKGMLGTQLETAFRAKGFEVVGSDREVDITDEAALETFAVGIAKSGPDEHKTLDWIVNCSAYTAVDKAETERELARNINVVGVENIAAVATMLGSKLVHFSTDYVFGGPRNAPLKETDKTNPESYYGLTKLEGEEILKAQTDKYFILRLSWLYGVAGPNFVKTMTRLMREKDLVRVVGDQRGQPTYVGQLIRNVVNLVSKGSEEFGTYHYGDDGDISWYDFAVEIQKQAFECGAIDRKVPVNEITTAEYPVPAKRPEYSVFDKSKVKSVLGFEVKPWKDNLAEYFTEWKKIDFK